MKSSALAAVIATAPLTAGGGLRAVASSLQLYVTSGGGTNGGTAAIFDSFIFTPSQLGQLFSVDQSVDGDFNLFVSRLTNGVNDLLTRIAKVSNSQNGQLYSESSFFSTRPPTGNGIDLSGFIIDRIDLTLDQITIDSPGSNPNADGIWTDYSVSATLSFLGDPVSVPEPSAAALLILACVCIKAARLKPSQCRHRSSWQS